MHVYNLCLQFFPGRLWFLTRIKDSVTADQAPAREHSWDRERKAGQSITGRMAPSHLFLHCTPGNKADPRPFFLGCDLLWPLTEGWTIMGSLGPAEPVWEACWTRGQKYLCPTICWICAGEGKSGRKIQTRCIESKCQARDDKYITSGDVLTSVLHFW